MRRSLFLVLLGTLVSVAPALAQTPISGIVLDSATSAPLSGVTVVDADRSATARTDRSGRFTLPCTGTTTLLFQKVGYAPARREAAGCGAELKVELSARAEVLAPVNVVALPERPVIERPQSVTTLTPHELNRSTGLFLRESLNLTPGVRLQSRTMAGGQTLTIRGYGTGDDSNNFIGSGYKAYYNGIPITDAEGQTILDDVDFASLGSVQVIRGPASSIYGGGIGGVVELNTALPSEEGTTLSLETLGGSYGLLRSTARLGHVSDGATTLLSYGHQSYDSYRIHSASKKDFGTFLGEFRPSDRQTVSTFVSYANSRDLRAGELDSLQFFREENTGEPPYLSNNARQEIESFRVGVTDRYRLSDRLESAATAFYTGSTRTDVYAVGLNSSAD
ncbi:MAG TPA: TonB-dependent receptor, partial [Longimicrobiaceae bacterium]|nr:TonB-dependent receptor [Longimicrobiaceae bacterium]